MYRLYNHGGMLDGGVGMPFGGLWMILLLVVPMLPLAVLLKYLITQPRGSGHGQGEQEMQTPLDVLKTAYRGEISREEHLRTGTTTWKSRWNRCFKLVSGRLPQGSNTGGTLKEAQWRSSNPYPGGWSRLY